MSAFEWILENSPVSGKRILTFTSDFLVFIFSSWFIAQAINDGVITVKIMVWVLFSFIAFDLGLLFLKRDHERRKARERKEELNW